MEISKRYEPKEIEDKIYSFWLKGGYFKGQISKSKRPFVIVIPPPNVTGELHMGHALNNTLQDILIRQNRMKGLPTLWVPGTDHAGIATQVMVEKQLAREGLTRQDLGREKFEKRVWQWVDKYGHIILDQLKKLGCSCDWERLRFTMDKGYSQAVKTAFLHYFKKGWIYQGERVVNWCTRCQTALSDIELEYKQLEGSLWFVRYPLKNLPTKGGSASGGKSQISPFDNLTSCRVSVRGRVTPSEVEGSNLKSDYIVVATTRPETMLGDTAVAVHPKDKRYKNLVGKILILPLLNREIPVVVSDTVDKEFGTGAVKVTPAHDPNDFEIGQRHKLAQVKVIDEAGKITDKGGKYAGQKTKEARQNIIKDLEKYGLLLKTEKYTHQVPHCYRCGAVAEQLTSKQWFLKMKQLAEPAIEVVQKGKIKFLPERWKKVYLEWMENLKDWCISRQIWWGHQLPVWYKQEEIQNPKSKIQNKSQIQNSNLEIYVGDEPPAGYKQVDDVLDTWFSSALWPIAVFLKKNGSSAKLKIQNSKLKRTEEIFGEELMTEDLAYFYPTSVLSTARDILYLWVARMIFSGLELTGKIPFSLVFVHPTVLTATGQRMSKSLGTGIDPMVLIAKYGADATRFGLAYQTTGTQDIRFSEDKIKASRNFSNKIWNSARFIIIQMQNAKIKNQNENSKFKIRKMTKADEDILSQLENIIKTVNNNLQTFKFGQAAEVLYQFFWHQFCDVYIEKSKEQLKDAKLSQNTLQILLYVLVNCLKLLHPFMPFVTEAIWQNLRKFVQLDVSIMCSSWPVVLKGKRKI